MQEALDRLTKNRTVVVIAHRLSTIQNAGAAGLGACVGNRGRLTVAGGRGAGEDVIVVLKGGKVVESGSHAQLMAKGGVYADLVHFQLAADQ